MYTSVLLLSVLLLRNLAEPSVSTVFPLLHLQPPSIYQKGCQLCSMMVAIFLAGSTITNRRL